MLAIYGKFDSRGRRIGYGTLAAKFECSKSTARDIVRGRIRAQQSTGSAMYRRHPVEVRLTPIDTR